ncbi:c-type cytochrome [Oryzibacter oryziterrae]|uniref:c-type cytochrome n=1 Tax=Oryzibacter oryziterrae TaxID=2766474 RepID=UPI001F3768DE|nr:cytochrome c [Oryzibacter oryziterrae]
MRLKLPMAMVAFCLVVASGDALAGQGETLYEATCGACHGPGGVGTTSAPPIAGTDLWSRLGGKAGAYLTGVMAAGMSGTFLSGTSPYGNQPMPAQLSPSPEDMVQIAYYILVELNGGSMDDVPSARDFAEARENPPSIAALTALRNETQ